MTPRKLSAGNVLLNAIALPLWTAIDMRWKGIASPGRLQKFASLNLERIACTFYSTPVSTAIGTNMWVIARCAYFVTLLSAAVSAAAHAWIAELCRCDFANVSGTVTSLANDLPRDHGTRVAHKWISLVYQSTFPPAKFMESSSIYTVAPHTHRCGSQVLVPSLQPTATWIISSNYYYFLNTLDSSDPED